MSRTSLDDLLDRSTPRVVQTAETDDAASGLARAMLQERARKGRATKFGIGVGAVVAALSLSVGTAVALPAISRWALWMPESDISYTTGPIEQFGETVTCTHRIAVLTDGKTADDGTMLRLYDARAFLQAVNLEDYQDEAALVMADLDAGERAQEELEWLALSSVIVQAMEERDLLGGGVKIATDGKCTPVP
jgi:hypothetical protein